jgi:acyl-CoA synthetase (AMP-forming)/AMP-acid ligase II
VVAGVQEATRALAIGAHLCALPLAVLLENVAGAMAALAQGATVHLRPAEALGWRGAAGFDAARLDHQVRQTGAESLILMPKMLQAWTARLTQGGAAPSSLKLVAVGGAAVGGATITAARAAGLPAFEGYGLSEGGSVQALNLPGANRPGSVGRALPHARIRVDEHGELHVGGALMLGYVGRRIDQDAELATGDVGHIDADGFVWIRGRRDNLIITGLGRNVSPEWVESLLREAREIVEAVVLPDGTGGLRAVLWPAAHASDEALQAAVDRANFELPDYARATHWMRARRAFDAASGLTTPGGKPLRAAIAAAHPETDQPTRQETHA